MKTIFKQLERRFGNHTNAAMALGIEPRTYRRMRNQAKNGVKPHILKLAKMVLAQPTAEKIERAMK